MVKPDHVPIPSEAYLEDTSPAGRSIENCQEKPNNAEEDEKMGARKMSGEPSLGAEEKVKNRALVGITIEKRYSRVTPRRTILVKNTEERKTTLSKYLVYMVECDPKPKGVVTVARRYSDFVWLRRVLTEEFPALWVPPLPPKKIMGRFEKDFVQGRRLDLQRFLDRIDAIDAFGDSEAFVAFLSSPESTFRTTTAEVEKEIGAKTWEDRVVKLQQLFPEIHAERVDGLAEKDLGTIKTFFDQCKAQLETLISSCQNCLTKHDLHAQEIATVTEAFKELYTIESNYPYCPEPKRMKVTKQFQEWEYLERQQTRLFELEFLGTIQHELEDVNALTELLLRREAARVRYVRSNTFATKLRVKEKGGAGLNNTQMLQKQAEERQERTYKDYLEIATKVLLRHETPRVWREKVESFETSMYNFSETQIRQTEKMKQIWSEAIQN